MDRLEAMEMLIEAVEAGSLSAAARRRNVPLPTLSRKVSDLEQHLGVKLLTRTTRSLSLTDAGSAYLVASKRILEQVEEAERSAAGEYTAPRGDLIITAPILFGRRFVVPIVTAFLSQYPEINVRLVLSDRNVHLVDDHIDMAVRVGNLPDSNLVATRVGSLRHVVCAAPAFLAAHGAPQAPEDLAGLPCVTHDFISPATAWPFKGTDGAALSVPIRSRFSVTTAGAALDAAVTGTGVARLLSYQVDEALKSGDLVRVLASFEPGPYPVNLMHAGRGLLPLKMRSFLDFAAPRLRASLQVLAVDFEQIAA
ncbi:MAG: LysR family transcriptional regulator [Bradyrhizobium sp.]|nr:LysR family transcriptional regulator [Bradyrhizobium sp.]